MSAVENIKEVAELIKRYNNIELNRKIVTLEDEVMDLTRDKRRLEDKVEELGCALKFKGELKFKDPYYWIEGEPSPYCPACWDGGRMAVHIVTTKHPLLHDQKACPSCEHIYEQGQF